MKRTPGPETHAERIKDGPPFPRAPLLERPGGAGGGGAAVALTATPPNAKGPPLYKAGPPPALAPLLAPLRGPPPPPSLSVNASGNPQQQQQQQQQQFQRLKVEDALSYLDQVKFKFGSKPKVYNDFLDIMKEFKSQSIDTPGVITRVSCLFRGHPELIVGFNTFLPPGYKIEVQRNDSVTVNMGGLLGPGMQTIVHTPTGVHTMGALGDITAIPNLAAVAASSSSSAASIQPVTPQTPTPQPAVAIRPVPGTLQHPTKFNSQPPMKENNNSSRPIEPNLLPQNIHLFATTTPPSTQLTSLTPHLNTASLTLSQPTPIAVTTTSNATVVTCATTIMPTGPPLIQPTPLAPQPAAQPAVITTTSLPHHPHLPHTPPTANTTTTVVVDRGVANQPIEFNHAINYVNKIKNRFQGQPDVYKQFLEILHTYQKDQKAIKEGVPPSGNHLTEAEVYTQVSKLFQNQEDLLSEFGQFLPEATNDNATSAIMMSNKGLNNDHASAAKKPSVIKHTGLSANSTSKYGIKRPPSGISYPAPKKPKIGVLRDVSLAEAGKFGTLNEFAFFDKVRKALRNTTVYENFLRCLMLFNQEVISRSELVLVTTPFLNTHPELFEWFKNFLSYKEGSGGSNSGNGSNNSTESASSPGGVNSSGGTSAPVSEENESNLPHVIGNRDRVYGDSAVEIDYATCKRLGASYCAVPKSAVAQAQSSKRSQLCREVLNDTWVSFPTWSEDSQFVTSRKTQYEESIYRTEDERFEFDVILETNRDTIKVLECVQRKMSRMPPEEAARYKLDDTLGGNSPTIHQRAIRRIYGDRSQDIIEGLKRNPVVAVPIVLKRLSQKDEEWREVQKNFNKTWRDQNEKYYLKSLDHQGVNFKQTDVRNLRCKSLQQEIETLYDERHEQMESSGETINGPHMTLDYSYSAILEDANNLLIHHVKRQPSINKEDKQRIKTLLKYFLMDIFRQSRQELSDDEKEDNDEDENENYNDSSDKDKDLSIKSTRSRRKLKEDKKDKQSSINKEKEATDRDIKIENKDGRRTPLHARGMEADETYTHMMCNNNWYLFFRLHNLLCERITKIYNQAVLIAEEESKEKNSRKESTAVALRLKPKNTEDYYPAFLDMVKNVLDGNMDIITFEDTLREMFGIHAYIVYTLDKVVMNAVRQLVNLVTEDSSIACQDLFMDESKETATGGQCASANQRQMSELLYQKRCEKLLTDQNCMKFLFYHQSGKVTVELLDTDSTSSSSSKQGSKLEEEAHTRKWHKYIDRFIQPGEDVSHECKNHLILKPVFLPRGIRSYRKSPFGKMKITNKTAVKNDQNSGESPDEKIKEEGDRDVDDGEGDDDGSKHLNSGGVVYEDNMQCNFNPRSFKVLYVIKSENCFYRRLALRRAKESHKTVSQRKSKGFSKWHSGWIEKNVSESQQSSISDWFMGLTDGLIPNKTHKIIKNHSDSTPYRTFFKWRADVS
ncbi:paired amphipathic helix protein Sin3a isoform X2 [Lepeophtheirus salmonis]|uniref:paired amphipathic helix protein Sin3a isoform X2 n=1 Tax=Lepeophtheirus salmonis TaxID=72036 RepID=UPI001AE4EEFD|nr:paired amphipathic helix protein Sin3a-like isoform X2 [Lepeophtheirus salmonis]